MNKKMLKKVVLCVAVLGCLGLGVAAYAATSGVGIAQVATNVRGQLSAIAKLLTAGSYVAGMAFAVGAVVKFKAHKDNPQQTTIGMPVALLFVGAALMFIPSVFSTSGGTLFGASGVAGGISGITSFGTKGTVAGSS